MQGKGQFFPFAGDGDHAVGIRSVEAVAEQKEALYADYGKLKK